MALLLLSWKVKDDRRWCRWTKNEATIIVDKRTSKPTLTEYTKGAKHQTWHRSFQNYEEAYDYIVNHF